MLRQWFLSHTYLNNYILNVSQQEKQEHHEQRPSGYSISNNNSYDETISNQHNHTDVVSENHNRTSSTSGPPPPISSVGVQKNDTETLNSVEATSPPSTNDELVIPKNPSHTLNASTFVQCMLQAESEILNPDNMERWDKEMVPIPYSVKIVNNTYNILTHLVQDHRSKTLTYKCNGLSGAIVDTDIYFEEFMVIQCPHTLDPAVTALQTYSGVNVTSNETVFSQNVGRLAECEKEDIQQLYMNGGENNRIKIGVTCAVHFRVQNIGPVIEWAAYHHAIGVDHIWIYVNRKWEDIYQNLPQKDYITWVPWNFHMPIRSRERRYREFKFQMQSMNDALWRAKRMGMNWIATIDLDEYIVVHGGEKGMSLQKYFGSNNITQGYAAIRMNSIPFGLGRDEKGTTNATKTLVIDYVYRADTDMNGHIRDREKLFLNPWYAKALDTHYLRSGPNKRIYWEKPSNLRINHYRNPSSGVFKAGSKNLTRDSLLMDGFHDVIIAEIRAL
jgi:hypothetical protein